MRPKGWAYFEKAKETVFFFRNDAGPGCEAFTTWPTFFGDKASERHKCSLAGGVRCHIYHLTCTTSKVRVCLSPVVR